jgi:hypothetical protein
MTPEDGHRIRAEIYGFFNDAFTEYFLARFNVLINVNVKVCFEISA